MARRRGPVLLCGIRLTFGCVGAGLEAGFTIVGEGLAIAPEAECVPGRKTSQSERSGRPLFGDLRVPIAVLDPRRCGFSGGVSGSLLGPLFPGAVRRPGRCESNALAGCVVLEYCRWPPRSLSTSHGGSASFGERWVRPPQPPRAGPVRVPVWESRRGEDGERFVPGVGVRVGRRRGRSSGGRRGAGRREGRFENLLILRLAVNCEGWRIVDATTHSFQGKYRVGFTPMGAKNIGVNTTCRGEYDL